MTRRRDRIRDRLADLGLHVTVSEAGKGSLGDWDDTMHTLAFLRAINHVGGEGMMAMTYNTLPED